MTLITPDTHSKGTHRMKLRSHLLGALALLAFTAAAAAQPQSDVMVSVGRGADNADIDLLRLAYRRTLPSDARWWVPTLVELGGGIWRVPNLGGTTQRFDLHATPVWRGDFARTYVEGGIGVYLLSHIINNDTTHMSTSFEFGSHIGAGLRIGERRETRVGVALQHLSNGGIKEPNSGVNFILLTASFPL
jgi:lipid A 3-O-deacylase